MKVKILDIFNNVQQGPVNHQKYIRCLKRLYDEENFEPFSEYILYILQWVLQKDYNNSSVKHILDFLAKFVSHISNPEGQENGEFENDLPTHPLLSNIIEVVLKYCKIENQNCRYNACSFISTLLTNMGSIPLDDDLCDLIESAMIENTKDPKAIVRLQAILALVRLQDPMNPDCPVIQAFLSCLKDPSHIVRREAVKRIAPNALTLPKLRDRTRDVNENVRCAAFVHCGDLGLTHFRIVQRQHVLRSGFNEQNPVVKKVFLTYFLPKWLSSVKGDYMTFFNAIRLDSDENDLSDTRELSKNLIEIFVKTEPINELIEALPLNSEKLIPLNQIDCDLINYWDILTSYLRKMEGMEEYLEMIVPELTAFCNYIDKMVTEKLKNNMNEMQYVDFESMLFYLLEMADNFDLSDEVGRNTLNTLTKKLLNNHWLQKPLLVKIIQIRRKLYTDSVEFAKEICQVITDKRTPIIETPQLEDNQKAVQLSKLKVELLCLKSDLESAVSDNEFQKAAVLKEKLNEVAAKLESLQAPGQVEIVRTKEARTDQNTVCWCLDLLTTTLAYGDFKVVPPSFIALREDFVKSLVDHKDTEIQWRTFKCIATFCMYDDNFAKERIKTMLSPIISYRLIPNYSRDMVVTSVYAISDLLRIHGPKLFEFDIESDSSSQNSTRRRLYTQDDEDVGDVTNQVSLEILLNIMLDMLDDEVEELRDAACTAYAKLILNGFYVTPTVMTRLILKWYSPAIGPNNETLQKRQTSNSKLETILQQKIGTVISVFPERIKEAKCIIAKSIIPVLSTIMTAPKTSPLIDVDPENVLKFLATIIQSDLNTSDLVQRELVHDVIQEISTNPSALSTSHFAKLLLYLNLDLTDSVLVNELIAQIELLEKKEDLDKTTKQNLQKFIGKLRRALTTNTTTLTTITEEIQDNISKTNSRIKDTASNPVELQLKVVLVDCAPRKSNEPVQGITSVSVISQNDGVSDKTVNSDSATENVRKQRLGKRRITTPNGNSKDTLSDSDKDVGTKTISVPVSKGKRGRPKKTTNIDSQESASSAITSFSKETEPSHSDGYDPHTKSTNKKGLRHSARQERRGQVATRIESERSDSTLASSKSGSQKSYNGSSESQENQSKNNQENQSTSKKSKTVQESNKTTISQDVNKRPVRKPTNKTTKELKSDRVFKKMTPVEESGANSDETNDRSRTSKDKNMQDRRLELQQRIHRGCSSDSDGKSREQNSKSLRRRPRDVANSQASTGSSESGSPASKIAKTKTNHHILAVQTKSVQKSTEKVPQKKPIKPKNKKISRILQQEKPIRQSPVFSAKKNKGPNLQVKRKKVRGKDAQSFSEEESIDVTDYSDSDFSDQTLHTIVEQSEFHMSLLHESQLNNSSTGRPRRLQVTTTHTDSDSPVRARKASRKI